MKKSSSKTTLICGLISMIVTIIFYLLAFDNIFTLPMRWLSLLFLLIVEVLGTAKALRINENIWGAAFATVSIVHLAAVLILSLVFVNIFPMLLKEYCLFNLLLLAFVALADVLLLHFGQKSAEANRQYSLSSSVMDKCLSRAQRLLLDGDAAEFKPHLEEVVEALKYSNRSALSGSESTILSKLDDLHEAVRQDDGEAVKSTVKEILDLLKLRTIQLKKSGSF